MLETIRTCKPLIVETDTKRNKAVQKAAEEKKLVERKLQAIHQLQTKLNGLKRKRDQLRKKHSTHFLPSRALPLSSSRPMPFPLITLPLWSLCSPPTRIDG